MAIGVGNFSKKKTDNTGQLLSLAGMAGGAVLGGPAGAMMGSQIGGMAGGLMQKPEQEVAGPVEASALDRRKQQLDSSPQSQIRESIDSLQYIQDPALKQQLGAPLIQADILAKRKPVV